MHLARPAFTLRSRLVLLVLLAVLPALALILYSAREDRNSALTDARQDALRETDVVGTNVSAIVEAANDLLVTMDSVLATLGPFAATSPGGGTLCATLFSDLRQRVASINETYAQLYLASPDGTVQCTAFPVPAGLDVSGVDAFRRALLAKDTVLGDYRVDPATGKATVAMNRPVLASSGEVVAMLGLAFDLDVINSTSTLDGLPDGSILLVIDRNGTVLTRTPPAPGFVGEPIGDPDLLRAVVGRAGQTTQKVTSADGVERLYALAPLRIPGDNKPYVGVGLPTATVFAEADSALKRNLIGLAVVAVLGLAAAWVTSEFVILRRVRALAGGTARLAGGDFEARVPESGNDELTALARSFNAMTTQLSDGRAELQRREMEFRAIFDSATDGLLISDPESGVIVEVNPELCRMQGATREQLIGQLPARFIEPGYRAAFANITAVAVAGEVFRARGVNRRADGTTYSADVTGTGFDFRGKTHVLAVVRDVTDLVEAEKVLEQRVTERTRELSTLLQVARSVGSTLEIRPLLRTILEQMNEVIDYGGATVTQFTGGRAVVLESRRGREFRGSMETEVGMSFPFRKEGPIWGNLGRGMSVVIEDVHGESAEARLFRASVGPHLDSLFEYVRSWMAVPLTVKGEAIGMLSAGRPEAGYFTPHHGELLSAFAAQASVALENARLFEEAQRRVRETEALAGIAADLTLDQPLAVTLDAIGKNAAMALGAVACAIHLGSDPAEMHVAGGFGLPDWYRPATADRPAGPGSLRFQATMTGKPVVASNVRERLMSYAENADRVAEIAASPWQTLVVVPVQFGNKPVGALTIAFDRPYGDDPESLRLPVALADQAAAAIENARLFEEMTNRAKENAALAAIAANVTLERPMRAILDGIAQSVLDASPALACAVTLIDIETDRIRMSGGAGLPDGYVEANAETVPASDTFNVDALGSNELLTVEDARQRMLANPTFAAVHGFLRDVPWDDILIVPVHFRGTPMGALNVGFRAGVRLDENVRRTLRAIADQAAIAVENVRLYEQSEKRIAELEAVGRVAASLTVVQPIEETIMALAETVVSATNALGCSVSLFREDGSGLRFCAGSGLPEGYCEALKDAFDDPGWGPRLERFTQDDRVIPMPDARTMIRLEPLYGPVHRFMDEVTWDSSIIVPLRYQGRTIGGLSGYYATGQQPREREIDFLRAVADQAAVAVRNVQLFSEVEQQAAEQEALASVAAELTYDRPLPEFLDALAANVVRSTRALACSLAFFEGSDETLYAGQNGLPAGFLEASTGRLVAERKAGTSLESLMGEVATTSAARAQMRAGGELSHLAEFAATVDWDVVMRAPLNYRGQPRGALVVYLPPGPEPDAGEQRFYRAIADQASVAAENARLFAAVQERTRQIQALYRADEELHRSLKLDEVLAALLNVVVETMEATDAALILWEPGTIRPRLTTARTKDRPDILAAVEESISLAGRAQFGNATAVTQGILVVEDTRDSIEPLRSRTLTIGVRSVLETAITVGGEFFGILDAVYARPRSFSAEERQLFTSLAKRASLAIENARLYEQALALAAVEERQRLARELHDSVSQALYGIALGARTARTQLDRDPIKAIEPVDYVLSLAEAGLAEMRALIFELRPESLASEGLVAALEKQIASTRARYGVAVKAEMPPEPDLPLPVKEALYRVIQEALHNVVKHARASQVDLALVVDGEGVHLSLRDNGLGFDPDGDYPGHLGLRSMRERIERLGGEFQITSKPGEGAHVSATLPHIEP